jgi:HEPN domain
VVDEEFIQNLMQQVHELWINPEIERRREAGRLPDDFAIRGAQVIMNLDADAPEVRFNEEVKVLADAEWAREVDYGEDVTEADVESISDLTLTDHDPNAGHLTMMLFKGRWIIAFDFRYNATRVARTLNAAREFLDGATFALDQHHMRLFADNLFSATELMAKGKLLMDADKDLLRSKKHTFISSRFNLSGKWGHTDPRYVKILNRLQDLRGPARYLDEDFTLSAEEASDMLGTAEDMFVALSNSAPKRYKVGDD